MGKKVIIVGGVAGGASTAARLRRLDESAEITIFEKSGYVSFANCGLPYYLGGEIQQWSKLQVTTPDKLKDRFNLNVHVHKEVVGIDRASQTVTVRDVMGGETSIHKYDELVLAVGCEALIPRMIPGIVRPGHFALRNLEDTSAVEAWLVAKHPSRVVVCGGGFIGLEVAEQLINRSFKVAILEAMDQVMAPLDREMAEYLHRELKRKGVELYLGDPVSAFEECPGVAASEVVLKSGTRVKADVVILALGIRPLSKLAGDAGIELTERGFIKVKETMQSVSDPHVWAVGDAIEVHNPVLGGSASWAVALGGPANRQGRLCADHIAGKQGAGTYKGTFGASVVKIFDLTAASVGINEKMLRGAKVPYKAVYLHPNQHAGYYPGATAVNMKLVFDPTSGRIWGAQAVGKDGVEKRIDVISTAMQAGLRAPQLADLELCYAPPYGSARDPVNYAGMIAGNIMEGLLDTVTPLELIDMVRSGAFASQGAMLLDVRDQEEITADGPIDVVPEDARLHVPLGQLRGSLGSGTIGSRTPKGLLVVSCASGQRANVAFRMLVQRGFPQCKILTGSSLSYALAKASVPPK